MRKLIKKKLIKKNEEGNKIKVVKPEQADTLKRPEPAFPATIIPERRKLKPKQKPNQK